MFGKGPEKPFVVKTDKEVQPDFFDDPETSDNEMMSKLEECKRERRAALCRQKGLDREIKEVENPDQTSRTTEFYLKNYLSQIDRFVTASEREISLLEKKLKSPSPDKSSSRQEIQNQIVQIAGEAVEQLKTALEKLENLHDYLYQDISRRWRLPEGESSLIDRKREEFLEKLNDKYEKDLAATEEKIFRLSALAEKYLQ